MTQPRLLHMDEDLLVIEKPAGLLSVPGRGPDKHDSVSARVQAQVCGALIVHRLDMATSGLMIMARHPLSQRLLSAAFERRAIEKRYVAVVHGQPASPTGDPWQTIDLPLRVDWPRRPLQKVDIQHGKPSQTRWRTLSRGPATTRLALESVTGRSHQLRVHLQAIGHPIVGDALYGPEADSAERLMLHASGLTLAHPTHGQVMRFESEPPF